MPTVPFFTWMTPVVRLAWRQQLALGGLVVQAVHAPCHTRGSLVYVLRGPTPVAFVGDTLFCGGCGAPGCMRNSQSRLRILSASSK